MADEPIAQECVEGYLFTPGPIRTLILRRTPARDRIWVPMSGKVEPTDASWLTALRRELREETGFALPEGVRDLEWHVPFDGPDGRRWRLHAYGIPVESEWSPVLSAEHEAFAWVSPAEAIARLHYEDNRAAVRRLLAALTSTRTAPS